MAEVTRTTAKTYFNTGDTPTEAQFANVLDSVPFPATDAVFTPLTGTVWDGNFKTLTLTANTALTFNSGKRAGVLIVKQDATGSRTLTINGTAASINSAANSTSIISYIFNDVLSDYVFSCETNLIGVTGAVDLTAPTLVSAVISNSNPSMIVLTYNEAIDAASTPATTDFDIHVNGTARNRDTVSVSGSTINIHLVSPVVNGDTVVISYLAGGANKIQDTAGNDAAAFIDRAVTNNVTSGADTTAPTVVSKTATDSTHIRIVFSEAVNATLAGWSFKKNGSALAASAISGSGTTWDFTVAAMALGDTLVVSYDSAVGATLDLAATPNELVSFTDSAVTNSIPGIDSDVAAWATASGITDSTYKGHVNTFVNALKTAGIFATHFDFLHILCGGDATKTQYNLINPANTDAAYRLTYPNSATFAPTGITTNGTNQYIQSHWIGGASTRATDSDYHIAVYERSAAAMTGTSWGVYETANGASMYMYPYMSGNFYVRILDYGQVSQAATTGKGFFLVQSIGTGVNSKKVYRDSTLLLTGDDNGNGNTLPDVQKLVFNASNNNTTLSDYRAAEISIISAGKSFNSTQLTAYQNAVAQLVTNLGL